MNILVVGRRREGKSTLALYLAKRSHKAVIVFDPRGMFHGEVVNSGEELEAALQERQSHGWNRPEDETPIVYRYDGTDPDGAFDEMAAVLFPPQFTRGGFALIVDEAAELQGPMQINPQLRRAVAQHPFEGDMRVTIIQTSHRLTEYHGKAKSLVDELYIFRTTNPRDLAMLLEYTGEPQAEEEVKDLPKHHVFLFKFARQDDGVNQYEVWDDPTVWYSPIEGSESPSAKSGGQDDGLRLPSTVPVPVLEGSAMNVTIH